MLSNSQMTYIEAFYGWPNVSTLFAQIESSKGRKIRKGRTADRAPCMAVERRRQQEDCVVNEIQHAKWISELG